MTATVGDGTQALPPVAPGSGGFHVWGVTVDGTDTTLPVSACGATVRVRASTALSLVAPPTVPLGAADNVSAQVTLSGLPFGGPINVTTTVFGLAGHAARRGGHLLRLARLGAAG